MLKYLSLRLIATMRPSTCGMNFCGFRNEDYTKTTPKHHRFMVWKFFFVLVFWDTWGMLVPGVPWGIFLDGKIQDPEKPPGLSANITTMHHKKWLKKELGARCKDHGPTRCEFIKTNQTPHPKPYSNMSFVDVFYPSSLHAYINNPILTPFPHQESTHFLWRLELRRNMSQPQVIPTHS